MNLKIALVMGMAISTLASFPKIGSNYLVSQEEGSQQNADATTMGCGHIIVWESKGQEGSGIKGQIYGCEGNKKGEELIIQTSSEGVHRNPTVAALDDGFIVAWDGPTHIISKKFDQNGYPVSDKLLVHPNNAATGSLPSVTSSGGGYLLVWERHSNGGSNMQFFNSDTTIASAPLQFGSFGESQLLPHAAALTGAEFVITWCSGDNRSGHWQRFNSNGESVSSVETVSGATEADFESISQISVTALAQGGFAMTWGETFSTRSVVQLKVVDELFAVVSDVVVTEVAHKVSPVIATVLEGIVVVWTGPVQGSDLFVTSSQEFDLNGQLVGYKSDISNPAPRQGNPRISSHAVGYVITWESADQPQEQEQQSEQVSYNLYATNYGYTESWGSRNLVFIFIFTMLFFCLCATAAFFVWRSCWKHAEEEPSNA